MAIDVDFLVCGPPGTNTGAKEEPEHAGHD
jgi:hypothetical protein